MLYSNLCLSFCETVPLNFFPIRVHTRVSSETSFASKQPKMEPKLVSALSKTKHLFQLFRFFTETVSFGVSIEPKQKKINRNKPKWKQENLIFLSRKFFHFRGSPRPHLLCYQSEIFTACRPHSHLQSPRQWECWNVFCKLWSVSLRKFKLYDGRA